MNFPCHDKRIGILNFSQREYPPSKDFTGHGYFSALAKNSDIQKPLMEGEKASIRPVRIYGLPHNIQGPLKDLDQSSFLLVLRSYDHATPYDNLAPVTFRIFQYLCKGKAPNGLISKVFGDD